MGKQGLGRLAAATGIIDVLLTVVALVIVPAPPAVGSSARDVAAYYSANGDTGLIGGYIAMLALVFFLWFTTYLYAVLARAQGEARVAATLFLSAALVTAANFLVFTALGQTLPFRASDPADLAIGHALSDVFNVGLSATAIPALVMVGAASVALLRTTVVARWVGLLGLLIAAVLLLASTTLLARSGPFAAGGIVFLLGYGSFLLWELLVSIMLLLRGDKPFQTASASATNPA